MNRGERLFAALPYFFLVPLFPAAAIFPLERDVTADLLVRSSVSELPIGHGLGGFFQEDKGNQ